MNKSFNLKEMKRRNVYGKERRKKGKQKIRKIENKQKKTKTKIKKEEKKKNLILSFFGFAFQL